METNRTVGAVMALVVAAVVLLVVVPPALTGHRSNAGEPGTISDQRSARETPDRTRFPVLDGAPLVPVTPENRPPVPDQWEDGRGPIPSNSWWSSAVTGPGAISIWPQPLGLAIDAEGRVSIASPARVMRADGTPEAPLVPALTLDLGSPAVTRVVDHGPLHVRIRLGTAEGQQVGMTLVQGSPMVELEVKGSVSLRVPGLGRVASNADATKGLRFRTARGSWILGSAGAAKVTVGRDLLEIQAGDQQGSSASARIVLGPVPRGAGAGFDASTVALAAHPLVRTAERIGVSADGTTTQVLSQTRSGAASSLWALQPQHQRFAVGLGQSFGTVPSALGDVPVVAGAELRLVYPAVPVLWSSVPLPGAAPQSGRVEPVAVEGAGSYFGGKRAYGEAALGDTFAAAGNKAAAAKATAAAAKALDDLHSTAGEPHVRWDDRWGTVIVEPAEFGAGTELNDHQFQYGYWVAAAAHVAEADPAAGRRLRGLIDLLIADYAGAATVPGAPSSLPAERTWSPYEGHSWASGTAPFAAGNNLESISESSLAWWAAARWFLSTGRPKQAAVFIGRFTIETAVTGYSWLPQGAQLPARKAQRPWSGVVWSAKADPTTWFDPSSESALGIRLLPLGPASLARYGSGEAVAAARARWTWCARYGNGCTKRWANLLDSDAAVAGRPPISGPTPEPSVLPAMGGWWRDLWERSTPTDGWSCSTGAVARRNAGGTVIVLASNPGPTPVTMTCRDTSGAVRWTAKVTHTATGKAGSA